MFEFNDIHLLVFAKVPQIGRVKTRMQPVFSEDFSLQLHCALVDYCLAQWHRAGLMPISLWSAGEAATFLQHLPQWQGPLHRPQQGEDLGERMAYAAQTTLANSRGVILVGTDCPFIDKHYLLQACQALQDHDVVLGPAADGGYVLMGLNGVYPSLFKGMAWGTGTVFEDTLAAIQAQQLRYHCLPVLPDIDRPEDVLLLKKMKPLQGFADQWPGS